jgi:hypothetical protein
MKLTKKATILFITAAAVLAGGAYVVAQLSTDTYDDDSKIAASWNISTSTPGQITLKDKACNASDWFCTASTTCANTLGDGDYIIVYQTDAPTTRTWKSAATLCLPPQCDSGTYTLTADNTVDFTAYSARDYCKSIGGRLPTITELSCIYTNKASFGTFGTGNYWSAMEYSGLNASYVNFLSGAVANLNKTVSHSVRCVRGW